MYFIIIGRINTLLDTARENTSCIWELSLCQEAQDQHPHLAAERFVEVQAFCVLPPAAPPSPGFSVCFRAARGIK